jgi:cell wall assembly regulator SMI1
VTDISAYEIEGVDRAWARIEASLSTILPASLQQLEPPAEVEAIDAVEAALGVVLPQDFRASLLIHNGTKWIFSADGQLQPSPVPLNWLYNTNRIVEATRTWRDNYAPDPPWDDPQVWAYLVDEGQHLFLNGPVRPIVGSAGAVMVGDMNGDVNWFLDLDPPPGGTSGQVARVEVECSKWDVLAPSWTQLLVRYANDLELFATAPERSPLKIDQNCGPDCDWGSMAMNFQNIRPAWLREVQALDPHAWET